MHSQASTYFSPLSLAVFVDPTVQIPEEQFPELRFDFPRIPSSPTSLSSPRARRDAGNSEAVCWAGLDLLLCALD